MTSPGYSSVAGKLDMQTPRTFHASTPSKSQVSFAEIESAESGLSFSSRRASEMNALRSVQTARAVVLSERQKLLSKTQTMSDRPLSERDPTGESDKKASEEQLFEEVALLMQERDLLIREKSGLQAILASSADEIRRLFEAEQKHVAEMKSWLQQKEDLESSRDSALVQLENLRHEIETLKAQVAEQLHDKDVLQSEKQEQARDIDNLSDRLSSAQHELSMRRAAEKAHMEEREEWLAQQDAYTKQIAAADASMASQKETIEHLVAEAGIHNKEKSAWEAERVELVNDRNEMLRLRAEAQLHQQEAARWSSVHEQLLKERADAHSQLQLGLQQMDQQHKSIELHNTEKNQWLKQQEAASQARAAVEARNKALEEELAQTRQTNAAYAKECQDLTARNTRFELELAEGARHLAAARNDYEKVSALKSSLQEECEATAKELQAAKAEQSQLDGQLRDTRVELSRVAEYEHLYQQEKEEKLVVESRLTQRLGECQELCRSSQDEARQLQEMVDMLKSEVQHLNVERQGLVDERSRLQHRLRLTLQELEHLRSNEKRYETESADWLHTHSTLLERVLRHGRD